LKIFFKNPDQYFDLPPLQYSDSDEEGWKLLAKSIMANKNRLHKYIDYLHKSKVKDKKFKNLPFLSPSEGKKIGYYKRYKTKKRRNAQKNNSIMFSRKDAVSEMSKRTTCKFYSQNMYTFNSGSLKNSYCSTSHEK
jgi:hypothetical protein